MQKCGLCLTPAALQSLQAMHTCVEAAFCLRSSLTRSCWAKTVPKTEARATLCCNDASAGAAFRRLSRMVLIVSASVRNPDMLTPLKAIRSFGLPSDMLLMTPLEYMVCTSTEADHPARDYRILYYINGVPEARHLAQSCLWQP